MSNTAVTQLVGALAGILTLGTFGVLVVVPVVSSYQRVWERLVAGLLSLWVLAALVGIGVIAGAGVIYYWPRVF